MSAFCMVCGGDHVPSPSICDSDGMDRQIARLGGKRWNALTAHISRTKNREVRAMLTASTIQGGSE